MEWYGFSCCVGLGESLEGCLTAVAGDSGSEGQ